MVSMFYNPKEVLKLCPFCRGKARTFKCDYHTYKTECTKCGVSTKRYEFKENAIACWNRRMNDENP